MQMGNLSVEATYISNLQRLHSFYPLNNGMAFAIADLLPSGQLAKSFCLIQRIIFHSASDLRHQENIFSCSCEKSQQQQQRLFSTNRCISEPMQEFCTEKGNKQVYSHEINCC